MKRGYQTLALLTALIFTIGIISAGATAISVKTLGSKQVMIRAVTPDDYTYLDSGQSTSNPEGDVTITLNVEKNFVPWIWVKESGKVILSQKYEEEYAPGESITLELYPDWLAKQKALEAEINSRNVSNSSTLLDNSTSNQTIENLSESNASTSTTQENLASNTTEESSKFSGLATFGDGNNVTKVIYYVIGIILILIAVFLIIRYIRKKEGKSGLPFYDKDYKSDKDDSGVRVRKLSELLEQEKKTKEVLDAERKLREAQEEIEKLKSKDSRESQLKREIVEKERELMRLRRGE